LKQRIISSWQVRAAPHQFGFAAGGPNLEKQAVLFSDYQGNKGSTRRRSAANVPTAAQRQGKI